MFSGHIPSCANIFSKLLFYCFQEDDFLLTLWKWSRGKFFKFVSIFLNDIFFLFWGMRGFRGKLKIYVSFTSTFNIITSRETTLICNIKFEVGIWSMLIFIFESCFFLRLCSDSSIEIFCIWVHFLVIPRQFLFYFFFCLICTPWMNSLS